MNIFVLDIDVYRCAEYHLDRHSVKMVLETTQLLNNAMIAGNENYTPVYKKTHYNHPASIWCRQSIANYNWLANLGLALCEEYTYRYGREHKCQRIIELFSSQRNNISLPNIGLTDFALCMPDKYKVNDAVQSYRNYYRGEKAHIAKWTKRSEPDWWI